jgi:hypothetical protein
VQDQQLLFSAQRKDSSGSHVRHRWPEASSGIGKISILGVLRLRALEPFVCDRSAERFAQDDGFVWSLKYNWLDIHRTSGELEIPKTRIL